MRFILSDRPEPTGFFRKKENSFIDGSAGQAKRLGRQPIADCSPSAQSVLLSPSFPELSGISGRPVSFCRLGTKSGDYLPGKLKRSSFSVSKTTHRFQLSLKLQRTAGLKISDPPHVFSAHAEEFIILLINRRTMQCRKFPMIFPARSTLFIGKFRRISPVLPAGESL